MNLFDNSLPIDRSDLEEVRQSFRKILKRFGPDYWRECDRERAFPSQFMKVMASAGYLGVLIPEDMGGLELGPSVATLIVEEINRSGGDAAVVNAQMAICQTLVREGSDEQRRYLPKIADGSIRMLTVAATEPDSGADMSELESVARRDGDDWRLDARKIFISLAEHTDLMILLVRTEQGPTLFLLDMRDIRKKVEIRPVDLIANRMTTMLFIDGLRVPDSARLGPVGGGLRGLMRGFAIRRVLAAAESIGNARFFLQISADHASERKAFDRVIGQNQGVQYPLVQAFAKVEAADLMRWDAIQRIEMELDAGGRSALAKILASEAAWESARAALTTFGGWGLASEVHVERKLRDATIFVFNNMLMSYVAEQVMGLPKAF
ncbi:MAG: acyl-CoA dehydrogenase [Sorangium cellulosum]|nr:MAG: acyl-CoA dehydrogenase [Sorangium cellulosum]